MLFSVAGRYISRRLVQLVNALSPIDSKPSGSVSAPRSHACSKARAPMVFTLGSSRSQPL